MTIVSRWCAHRDVCECAWPCGVVAAACVSAALADAVRREPGAIAIGILSGP